MLFQRRHQGIVALAVLLEERLALVACERKPSVARREQFKEAPATLPDPLCFSQQGRRAQVQQAQRPGSASRASSSKPVIRNLVSRIIAGHVFHLVRFIEHHRRIFRQDAPEIILLEGENLQKNR